MRLRRRNRNILKHISVSWKTKHYTFRIAFYLYLPIYKWVSINVWTLLILAYHTSIDSVITVQKLPTFDSPIKIKTNSHRNNSIFLLPDFFYGNSGRDIPSEWVHWKVRSMESLACRQGWIIVACVPNNCDDAAARTGPYSAFGLIWHIFNYVAATTSSGKASTDTGI